MGHGDPIDPRDAIALGTGEGPHHATLALVEPHVCSDSRSGGISAVCARCDARRKTGSSRSQSTARDAVKNSVRARLALDPAWKAISDDKKAVREELALTLADDVDEK